MINDLQYLDLLGFSKGGLMNAIYDVVCEECLRTLKFERVSMSDDDFRVLVSPWPDCIKEARLEAKTEGHGEGYNEGVEDGREQMEEKNGPEYGPK